MSSMCVSMTEDGLYQMIGDQDGAGKVYALDFRSNITSPTFTEIYTFSGSESNIFSVGISDDGKYKVATSGNNKMATRVDNNSWVEQIFGTNIAVFTMSGNRMYRMIISNKNTNTAMQF